MAHQTLPPFDPFHPRGVETESRSREDQGGGRRTGDSGSAFPSFWDNSTAHLALDVALFAMAEQARLATSASGAAIALTTGEKLICRAASGENAPDLGIAIDLHSGLSGASVQTRRYQRCDDAATDPRVHGETSRRLGIRSVLVVPLLRDDLVFGLIEIFSPHIAAFGERDLQTLEALSRRVMARVVATEDELAVGFASDIAQEEVGNVLSPPAHDRAKENPLEASALEKDGDGEVRRPPARDWTMILNVLVIATALVLGWFLGHPIKRRWVHKRSMAVASAAPALSSVQLSPPAADSSPAVAPDSEPPTPVDAIKQGPQASRGPVSGHADLTIYQNGHQVFPNTLLARASPPLPKDGEVTRGTPLDSTPAEAAVPRLHVAPEIAQGYVLQRVEPQYPEEARQKRIQGPVVMNVFVGKDGSVEQTIAQSGDPALEKAAADAIKLWRFRPFFRNGQLTEVETRVTINFRLP